MSNEPNDRDDEIPGPVETGNPYIGHVGESQDRDDIPAEPSAEDSTLGSPQ